MRVIIVGGGIGGVCTALALRRHSIDYVILEQAPALTEVGAGVQLSPNGVRVLEMLGIGEKLATFCVEPMAHRFQDWQTAEPLLTLPLMPHVREAFGQPYYHAHRADLLAALVDELAGDRLRLGARVVAVGQDLGAATATLADGETFSGDVLIGADGIHSLVRETVFAPDRPRFAGYSAWRGMVAAEAAAHLGVEKNAYVWPGPGRSVVVYYISGGRTINWIAIGQSPGAMTESWSARGTTADALREVDGWHSQVRGLVAMTPEPLITRLYDREPLAAWSCGRVALLGDAAHAMLPYHAQGAVQSIEDAWVLAGCLALALARGTSTAEGALARYEGLRKARTAQVQQQSRAAQASYHLRDPVDIAQRNARYRRTQAEGRGGVGGEAMALGFSKGQTWLYAYDAEKAVRGEDRDWQQTTWGGGSGGTPAAAAVAPPRRDGSSKS